MADIEPCSCNPYETCPRCGYRKKDHYEMLSWLRELRNEIHEKILDTDSHEQKKEQRRDMHKSAMKRR